MNQKYFTIGIILLFIGGAVAPSINFTTVNASTNSIHEERITPKDLLFQTIIDVANNKDIQKIVSDSEMQSKEYVTPQIITKRYLNTAYRMGLILTKVLGVNRIQSLIQRYQMSNSDVQKDISEVIERNLTLKSEMMQLSSVSCGCDSENLTSDISQNFICDLFLPLALYFYFCMFVVGYEPPFLFLLLDTIDETFNCWWGWNP